jgi:thioredoxin
MKKLFAYITAAVLSVSCNAQNNSKIQVLEPIAFYRLICATPQVQLVDVRSANEFAGQHLEQAVNVDINEPDFEKKVAQFDRTKPILVYCMVGGRSQKAAAKLAKMGFNQVYDLEGGIMKWNADGYGTPAVGGMTKLEYDKLIKSDKKVLISFFATWCGPCKKMTPYMTALEKNQSDNIKVIRLDADENKALAQELKVHALPTIFLFIDGNKTWEHKGFISEKELKTKIYD